MIKEKKNRYTYIHIVFVIFVLIFKFILIYLLHVLLVFKIKGIFKKKNPTQKCAERDSSLYIYYRYRLRFEPMITHLFTLNMKF